MLLQSPFTISSWVFQHSIIQFLKQFCKSEMGDWPVQKSKILIWFKQGDVKREDCRNKVSLGSTTNFTMILYYE